MKSKFLTLFMLSIFSIFLIGSVNAILVYGDWENGLQNTQITQGQSISFNADFFSMKPPMTLSIKIYDSSSHLIYSFENNKVVNDYAYYNSYTITEQIYEDTGNFEIVLTGSDIFPSSDTHTLYLKVNEVIEPNHPPVITSTPIYYVNEGQVYSYDVEASDADNDVLAYSLIDSPNWLSINSQTGLISGTAPMVNANTGFNVKVKVSDGKGGIAYQTYTLTVKNGCDPNSPPIITSTPIYYVNEGNSYNYQVVASDADNDVLAYSLIDSPNWLSINSQTGLVSGTAPMVSSNTGFNVKIKVSDGKGGIAYQTYTLTVKDVCDPNRAPVITSTPIYNVNEGVSYSYDVEATDADNDVLAYSLIDSPNWLSINSQTGLASGTAPMVNADTGFNVKVKVSDGKGGIAYQTYTLTVKDIDNDDDGEATTKGLNEIRWLPEDEFYTAKYMGQFGPLYNDDEAESAEATKEKTSWLTLNMIKLIIFILFLLILLIVGLMIIRLIAK